MKFKPFFLLKLLFVLIISLTTVLFLIDIHPASAQHGGVIGGDGTLRGGGTAPRALIESIEKVKGSIAQGNVLEAERLLTEFLKQKARDLSGEAVAHQALGNLYMTMNKPDLASNQMMSAKALYQALENFQGVSQVEAQLQEVESQQIQLQPGEVQVQVQQLPEIPTERLLRTIQAPQIRPEIVSPQIQSLQR